MGGHGEGKIPGKPQVPGMVQVADIQRGAKLLGKVLGLHLDLVQGLLQAFLLPVLLALFQLLHLGFIEHEETSRADTVFPQISQITPPLLPLPLEGEGGRVDFWLPLAALCSSVSH
jgi:hypothetical protein